MLDSSAEQTLRPELTPGERLLWAGRPQGGIRFRATDTLLIPFSLLWAGFAVFWELSVLSTDAPWFFKLWGIPFILVGAYITIGRFFADAALRARTWYGLTDRRALIISGFLTKETKSLPLQTMSEVTLSERGNGTGTITLGPVNWRYGKFTGGGWPGTARYAPPAFDLIADARQVYSKVRQAQDSARRAGA